MSKKSLPTIPTQQGISASTKKKGIQHPKRIHTPHDKLFKQILKDVEIAREFFQFIYQQS